MKLAIILKTVKHVWSIEQHKPGDVVVVNAGDQSPKKDEYCVTFLTEPKFTITMKRTDVKHLTFEEKKLVRMLFL